jgi:hypothetical protein
MRAAVRRHFEPVSATTAPAASGTQIKLRDQVMAVTMAPVTVLARAVAKSMSAAGFGVTATLAKVLPGTTLLASTAPAASFVNQVLRAISRSIPRGANSVGPGVIRYWGI